MIDRSTSSASRMNAMNQRVSKSSVGMLGSGCLAMAEDVATGCRAERPPLHHCMQFIRNSNTSCRNGASKGFGTFRGNEPGL